jgi:protein-disulfide isomerase
VIALAILRTVCLMCSALYLVSVGLFLASWWLQAAVRTAGRRGVALRTRRDRLVVVGSIVATGALVVIGSWEAFGGGVHSLDPEAIKREQPEFLKWYLGRPVVQMPNDPLDGTHARGSADAPVTIVEFSDFECSHCAMFHESLEDVLPRLGQTVRVIFRHFPLDAACNPTITEQIHPGACLAAVAAECAGEQGKFWQYHNLLFDNQQHLDRPFLIAYASRLALDVPRFTACLGSPEARARVERDAKAGGQLGIDSTPTIFINGRTIKGALDVERLTSAVVLASANIKTP